MLGPASWSARLRPAVRALVALCLAGPAVAAMPLFAAGSTPNSGASVVEAPVTAVRSPADDAGTGLVIVGTGGLHWTDVDRTTMPTLWRMITEGSVGSISVRTTGSQTCPVNAWLTVSAGRRALDGASDVAPTVPGDEDRAAADCLPMPVVTGGQAGAPAPADVADWAALTAAPIEQGGLPGTLGGRIAEAGRCATAVGPGAAVALADGAGHVDRYLVSAAEIDATTLGECPVTIVDAGEPAGEDADRQTVLRELDAVLRQVLDVLPDGWRVVVAGVHDTPVGELGLQVVVDWRSGDGTVGWLTSESTRRPGIVTLSDLAATALTVVSADTDDLDGAPLVVDSERRMSAERTVENRRYLTELTTTVPHLVPVLLGVLAASVLAAGGALVRARRRMRADGGGAVGAGPGPASRRAVTAVLLLAACAPAGAYLAALSRWWGTIAPTVAASLWTAVAATTVALAAWGVSRVLPRGPWRLGGAVAGLTWLVLTVDGLTGTMLQHGSILGVTPTLGARYYGFGNLTFAVYLASALVLAGALASAALARGRRTAAEICVLAVGLVTVVVDGWPAFGADFGGVFAIVPAFALLLIAVSSARPNARRILITALVTVATVTVVAVIDWLRPGGGSHLGLFVQRVVDGEALPVVTAKAAEAWATVANPLGAPTAVLVVVVCVALVGPERLRPAAVAQIYQRVPLLQPVAMSIVVAAVLGTLFNDSGIAVGTAVLAMAAVLVAASCSDLRPIVREPASVHLDAPLRRMPAVIVATGAGLLAALLLGSVGAPGTPAAAGDVTTRGGTSVVTAAEQVVVIGTSGLRWQDVSWATTPTLARMLRDGAVAGGVAPGAGGTNRRCASAGWLALSAGRAPVTGEWLDGTWTCASWAVDPDAALAPPGGAVVVGWDGIGTLQASSAFRPRPGVLGAAVTGAGACATAVGPGAALALADGSGEVGRYRDLAATLEDPGDAFACPVTIVDAGAAPQDPTPTVTEPADLVEGAEDLPTETATNPAPAARDAALTAVDATVHRVLQLVPVDAVVLIVDVGDPSTARPWLGIGLVAGGEVPASRFLSTSSTRWEGVARLLDVPTTILAAVGAGNPPEMTGSPLTAAGARPSDVATAVDQLAVLTVRDHALRGVAGSITSVPMLVALALLGVAALLGRRAVPVPRRRVARVVDSVLLVIASMPAGLFLMATWFWWRVDPPVAGMWGTMIISTLIVAGLGGLAPRRPAWLGPALISGVTAGVLTLDAVLGTPLHRGSPLGPAPTLGGRYYGFGNPTYSVFVVAMVVTAAALATWLVRLGRRRLGVAVAFAVALVTLVVDLWPTLGADIGGGLVLVPVCAVVVLAVAGLHVSWQRLVLIAAGGLVAVGAIGVLDWTRPAQDRSHLGRFVQSVIDQTAWETVARKAGYAAVTVTSGPTAWLTLAVLLATALLLWRRVRVRARWFERVEAQWPLVRPVLVALLIAAVGGAIVNDYGVRIATVMLFAAVPLVGLLAVRSLPVDGGEPSAAEPGDPSAEDPGELPAADADEPSAVGPGGVPPEISPSPLPCEGSDSADGSRS